MDRNEIMEKLKEIVVSADESLAPKMGGVTEETRILEDLGINSVGMLFIAVMIEETFGIQLNNVYVGSLVRMSDVITMVEERLP